MKTETNQRSAYLYIFSVLASVTVIGFYCFNVFPLSLNIPYRDDFQDILIFVVDFRMADSFVDALRIILHQHADHLTLSSRIMYYLVFLADGAVNFRTMTYISHLGLLLLTWIFYLQIVDKSGLKPLIFICLSLLLFNPRDYGIAIWPMAAFGFFFVYGYSLAALHFLNRPNNYKFFAAILSALLATFTMSIGQLVWVLGLIYLISQKNYLQTKFNAYLIIWSTFTVCPHQHWIANATCGFCKPVLQHASFSCHAWISGRFREGFIISDIRSALPYSQCSLCQTGP
jgi:hypothetical protein